MRHVLQAFTAALLCTILSYFCGGVRYDFGQTHFPPVWVQLGRNFLIYFALFLLVIYVVRFFMRKKK